MPGAVSVRRRVSLWWSGNLGTIVTYRQTRVQLLTEWVPNLLLLVHLFISPLGVHQPTYLASLWLEINRIHGNDLVFPFLLENRRNSDPQPSVHQYSIGFFLSARRLSFADSRAALRSSKLSYQQGLGPCPYLGSNTASSWNGFRHCQHSFRLARNTRQQSLDQRVSIPSFQSILSRGLGCQTSLVQSFSSLSN